MYRPSVINYQLYTDGPPWSRPPVSEVHTEPEGMLYHEVFFLKGSPGPPSVLWRILSESSRGQREGNIRVGTRSPPCIEGRGLSSSRVECNIFLEHPTFLNIGRTFCVGEGRKDEETRLRSGRRLRHPVIIRGYHTVDKSTCSSVLIDVEGNPLRQ